MAFSLLDLERVVALIRRRLRLLELQPRGVIQTGPVANLPDVSSMILSQGTTTLYYATDTKTLYIWNTQTLTWNIEVFS